MSKINDDAVATAADDDDDENALQCIRLSCYGGV